MAASVWKYETFCCSCALLLAAASFVTASPVHSQRYFRPKAQPAKPNKRFGRFRGCERRKLSSWHQPGRTRHDLRPESSSVTGIVYAGTIRCQPGWPTFQCSSMALPPRYMGSLTPAARIKSVFRFPTKRPVGQGAAQVEVLNNGVSCSPFRPTLSPRDSGIFLYNGNYAIAELPDYSLIGPDNPAYPGDTIVLYVTG